MDWTLHHSARVHHVQSSKVDVIASIPHIMSLRREENRSRMFTHHRKGCLPKCSSISQITWSERKPQSASHQTWRRVLNKNQWRNRQDKSTRTCKLSTRKTSRGKTSYRTTCATFISKGSIPWWRTATFRNQKVKKTISRELNTFLSCFSFMDMELSPCQTSLGSMVYAA